MTEFKDRMRVERERMVNSQIAARGVEDTRVLEVMKDVPREYFVKKEYLDEAFCDAPLSIGHRQTISQPYIVAYMTEKLRITRKDRVLEIGTGSGYQTAVLAKLAGHVYTIEIVEALGLTARKKLRRAGYTNISYSIRDGSLGWEEEAPFDAVMITAAPARMPEKIIEQLVEGGRMVVPVGTISQQLYRITRGPEELVKEELIGVRFVPMTGEIDIDP